MGALLGYVWRDTVRSHRWVAPLLLFLGIEAVISATAGSVLPTYGGVAVTVLFVAIWFAVIVSNNEDPLQCRVTSVTAGSMAKVRLAKLLVAFQATAALGILGLIAPAILSPSGATLADLGEGVVGVLATALAGVAIGAMCSRPIIKQRSWAFLCGGLGGLVTVLIPHCPPTRQLLVLFGGTGNLKGGLLLATGETVVLGVLIVATSLTVAWRRT